MEINTKINKKSFTLIELMVSIVLFSFLVIGSVKSYSYITKTTQKNEMKYLVLGQLDTQMARLIYSYENFTRNNFCSRANNSLNSWAGRFEAVPGAGSLPAMRIFNSNTLRKPYGLFIKSTANNKVNNIINIYNQGDDILYVGSIIGLMAWRIKYDTNDETNASFANISLSISYPYKVTDLPDTSHISFEKYNNYPIQTMNLKTSTMVKH